MRKNPTIICKTCGKLWKPFHSMNSFFDEHINEHGLVEPEFNGDYQEFLKERLAWKHRYFDDSRPDSDFIK